MEARIGAISRTDVWRWLGLVIVVTAFVASASSFLPHQNLWVDEATQMSGLGLGPWKVVPWLAGVETHDFDQYPDRTPPLSYWLGWGWSRVWGLSEDSMRWFGVVCVAMAVALVYEAALRAFGLAAAWGAGSLFALSPHVSIMAVEIRAYPLFLFWSAAALWSTIRLLERGSDDSSGEERAAPNGSRASIELGASAFLGVCLALSVATHYYGVVLSGAILTALFIESRSRPELRGPLLAITGAVALVVLAVSPLIVGASTLYGNLAGTGPGVVGRLVGVERLLVRLVTHPALSVHRVVEICAMCAAAVLLVSTWFVAGRGRVVNRAITVALASGLLAATIARLMADRFDALAGYYNAWMRPGFSILLSAGLAASVRPVRLVAGVAIALLVSANICGIHEIAVHGEYFAHGPHRELERLIRSLGAEVALVHDADSPRIDILYRPLRHQFGRKLEHYNFAGAQGDGRTIVRSLNPRGLVPYPVASLPYRYLLVVRTRFEDFTVLARQMRNGKEPLGDGPVARELGGSPDWRLASHALFVATDTAEVKLFERRDAGSRPTATLDADRLSASRPKSAPVARE